MSRFSELIRVHSVKSSRRILLDIPPGSRLFLLIKYGSGHLQTNRSLLPFTSGNAGLLSGGENAVLLSGNNKEISVCFVTVSDEALMLLGEEPETSRLLTGFFHPTEQFSFSDTYTPQERDLLAHYEALLLYAQASAEQSADCLFDHLALSFLIYAARHYVRSLAQFPAAAEQKPSRKLVASVTETVNRRYAEDLSLRVLAEEAYTSPSYLSRIFKEITGVTVSAYINQVRLANVKRLLSGTDDLIVDIASACGYNYIPYFNQLFRKTTGMTPTQYRQKHRKKKYTDKEERRV